MTIRKRRYASGRKGWQLNYSLASGKRIQRAFATRDEAEAEMIRLRLELRCSGETLLTLTDAERSAMMEARQRVMAVGASLAEAVEFFLRHSGRRAGERVTFMELRERCLEAKKEEGIRPRYASQLGTVARAFGRHSGHDALGAAEITAGMIEGWLKANQWAAKTWNGYRTDLQTIFAWGITANLVTLNPATAVPRRKLAETLGDGDVEFLDVPQCEALLRRAALAMEGELRRDRRGLVETVGMELEDYRLLVPAIVIGMFAGLRPEREVGLMTWASIKLGEGLVVVSSGRSKTRQRRTVDLSANALGWLTWCRAQGMGRDEDERILPPNFVRRWRNLRRVCGLFDAWPHDALRHTFATMHIAHHRDEARLQALMGHESAAMLFQHYRGLATPLEAAKFWALMPQVGAFYSG